MSPELLGSQQSGSRGGFTLGIIDQTPDEPEAVSHRPEGPLELVLTTETADGRPAVPGLGLDFYERLAEQRWPDGVTRMEKVLAAEQARTLEGGLVGLFGDDASTLRTVDLVALGRVVAKWWDSRGMKRLPAGASIPRDGALTLIVRDVDGSPPGHISVVGLTQGWIGDAVHARCDDRGRCAVDGLPSATSTLLVRGTGARIVHRNHTDRELTIDLKPTGWLRIEPVRGAGARCPRIRLLERPTGAAVPIIRWINVGREEWIRLTAAGLTLHLPEGRYEVQIEGRDEGGGDSIEVSAGETTTIEVAY